MIPVPDNAFILAAGMGTRLRPYTDTMPKPMVPVGGRPILDHTLDHLREIGVKTAYINLHYKADVIKAHLLSRKMPNIYFSEEKNLLDTGGGLKKCKEFLEKSPFYMINGDALWEDGKTNTLLSLAQAFDPETTDILLLLHPVSSMTLTHGVGDYDAEGNHATRNHKKQGHYMFSGIRIVHPRLFAYPQMNQEIFSFLEIMDEAEKRGRLRYIINQGAWHHISTPTDLEAVDRHFRGQDK